MQCKNGGKRAWQQKGINNVYHCKNQVQTLKVETQQEGLEWKHNKSECAFTNTSCSVKILHSKSIYILLVKTKTIVYNTHIV